jgi:glycosyltransferase involved in cell wall biosynthesis
LRLVLVTHYYPAHGGGIENAAGQLARALVREAGITIEWIASDCDPPPAGGDGLRCTPAHAWNGIERAIGIPWPVWSPRAVAALREAVAGCDAVHVHDSLYLGSLLAARFARRLGKRLIVTQHTGPVPGAGALPALVGLANRVVARRVLSSADRAFFVSPAVREHFARFCAFRAPPAYAPNGVDAEFYAFASAEQAALLRRETGRDARRPLCLFVGRFTRGKGIDLVLELARAFPQADWVLAGEGELPAGAPAHVAVLRGRRGAGIAALYRMADLLLLPSEREGFPLVVQEAMACGTAALVSPAVAEGCPAVAPLLFVEPLGEGRAERWGRRLGALLDDLAALRAGRAKLADAARAQWSWKATARAYATALGAAT